jgi:hypothetical protein
MNCSRVPSAESRPASSSHFLFMGAHPEFLIGIVAQDLSGVLWSRQREPLMSRRRGNPNWTKGQLPQIPQLPTAFEVEVRKLGLNEQTCATSKQLERWCERNRNRCYVPERLLKQWGLSVDADVSG